MQNLRTYLLIKVMAFCISSFLITTNAYSQSQTIKYKYDELGRLKQVEDDRNGNRQYDYDAVGNRLQVTVVPVAAPLFAPNGGTYVNQVSVSISSATTGATVRYTTNGSNVTISSPIYSTPIQLTSSATVKAKAFKTGLLDSAQTSANFTIQQPAAAPTISPNGGTHSGSVIVTLSSSTTGATVRYTKNGNNVTPSSPIYTAPIQLVTNTTVKAKAFKAGMGESQQTTAAFVVMPHLPSPTGLSSLPKSFTGTTGMYETKWNSVAGATYYILKNLNNSELTTTSTTVIQPSKGWWVKACNTTGCGLEAHF